MLNKIIFLYDETHRMHISGTIFLKNEKDFSN